MAKRRQKGSGAVRQLASGRWQARYPDPETGDLRPAPKTFDTRMDTTAWLKAGNFSPPETVVTADPSLEVYAAAWLDGHDIKPRTRAHYSKLLEGLIVPGLGSARLSMLTPMKVRTWHAALDATKPTMRAHAYSLLREIMATAVNDELLPSNPCRIKNAGHAKTRHAPRPASLGELDVITAALPDHYRAMVLLAAWCGLRFGELTELRRRDIEGATVVISRGVVRVDGGYVVGDPKSTAGKRRVAMPPHLLPVLEDHLNRFVGDSPDALIFPAQHGGHMAPSSLYRVWYPARKAAGRSDLHFHDLRHTGASLAAATGATLADLMVRIGHSTPAAAMRYQHALAGRDEAIAEELSRFAREGEVSLRSAPRKVKVPAAPRKVKVPAAPRKVKPVA